MTDPLKDTSPLGKSVEEIEQESGNTTNSAVPGEQLREGGGVLPLVPAAVATTPGTGTGGAAAVGATLVTQDGLGLTDASGDDAARRNDIPENGQA